MSYFENDEFYHHGILGQKWGIRRYQNDDGTLTDAGKARYDETTGKKHNPKNMTTEELNRANARLQAEQNYRNLTGTTQPDRAFVSDTVIKVGASVVASVGAAMLANRLSGGTVRSGKEYTNSLLLAAGTTALTTLASSVGGKKK